MRSRTAEDDLDRLLAAHRGELVAHCYRMLGSFTDAEDATQDALARAWRKRDSFEGRSSIRTWLYTIATNACLDQLRARPRRALPDDRRRPSDPRLAVPPALDDSRWVGPFPDSLIEAAPGDPRSRYATYEAVGLAFIAALQRLTPRQRAILILRDVMSWTAAEVAVQLGLSVPAVASALHRARSALRTVPGAPAPADRLTDRAQRALLERYIKAWISGDAPSLVALLSEEARFTMPPQPAWFRGPAAIGDFLERTVWPSKIGWRFLPTRANGSPAFGVYARNRSSRGGAAFEPHAIHVLGMSATGIDAIACFLDPRLHRQFGLPERI